MLGDYALVFSKCHSITYAIVSITGVGRKFKECCPHFPNEEYLQMLAICKQNSLRIPKIESLFNSAFLQHLQAYLGILETFLSAFLLQFFGFHRVCPCVC